MNNQHADDDKTKTLLHVRRWLRRIELAYEGYLCSLGYANATLPDYLRTQGKSMQHAYISWFSDSLKQLESICQEMRTITKSQAKGE